MYANEINSLLALTKAEHKAIANLATAVLALVHRLDEGAPPPLPALGLPPSSKASDPPGARLILDRLARARG